MPVMRIILSYMVFMPESSNNILVYEQVVSIICATREGRRENCYIWYR